MLVQQNFHVKAGSVYKYAFQLSRLEICFLIRIKTHITQFLVPYIIILKLDVRVRQKHINLNLWCYFTLMAQELYLF